MLSLAACSAEGDVRIAESGVVDFHRAYNASQFVAIHDSSDPLMKQAATREATVNFLSGVRNTLGRFESGKTVGHYVHFGTEGKTITLTRMAAFERGIGEERFIFRTRNSRPSLVGYNINSNDIFSNRAAKIETPAINTNGAQ